MKNHFKLFSSVGMVVVCLVGFFIIGCQSQAGSQKEIAITTKSDEARKIFIEGRELFDNIRFDEAREVFSQAIAKDPEFALAHLYRSFTSTSAMDFQKHLEHALNLKSQVSEGEKIMIQAIQANADNNPMKGIELFEQLAKNFPEDKRVQSFLGNLYAGQDQDDKAIARYENAIAIDQDYSSPYNSLGYAYRKLGEYENSEEAFKNYIRLIPDEANPHDSIADLYTKMGRYEDAIQHYQMATDLNPNFTMSQRKIGDNLIFMGKHEAARQAYRKALNMETTANAKLIDLGRIANSYVYEEKLQDAQNEAANILKMASAENLPEWQAGYHTNNCAVFLEMGDMDKAEQSVVECKKVVMSSDLSPSTKEDFAKNALFAEARIASKRGDFETAMAKADELKSKINLNADPKEMENHHELMGYISYDKGDYQKAVEHFDQADQDNPYALYHLALAEAKTGNDTRANQLFKKVADWNENSLEYAFVRSRANMAVKKAMTAK
ncbi:MAG: tetratricopeptide repeat protein [bacterium]